MNEQTNLCIELRYAQLIIILHLHVTGEEDLGIVGELEGVDDVEEDEIRPTAPQLGPGPSLLPIPNQLLLAGKSI